MTRPQTSELERGSQQARPPAAEPARAPAKPKAAAVEEEDDMAFANRIVSYNVLEFELTRLQADVKKLEESALRRFDDYKTARYAQA